ncbi:hypothetical protein [Methylophaga lonarensis]|uniref:hypothetical protein n=1 Tax=Methylophaga lonarensis TaxID=999151 RepID=UPI003D2CCAE3
MALIDCPECSRKVSDSAPSCPGCGCLISSKHESRAAGTQLTTVQETSKKFKFHMLLAVAAIGAGLVMLMAAGESTDPDESSAAMGGLLFTGGIFWYFVTRIRIWWHHK